MQWGLRTVLHAFLHDSSESDPHLKSANPLPAMTAGAVGDCGMRTTMLLGHFAQRQRARNVVSLDGMPVDFKAGHDLHVFNLPSTCCTELAFHLVCPPVQYEAADRVNALLADWLTDPGMQAGG